jgi:hypothetical protein
MTTDPAQMPPEAAFSLELVALVVDLEAALTDISVALQSAKTVLPLHVHPRLYLALSALPAVRRSVHLLGREVTALDAAVVRSGGLG